MAQPCPKGSGGFSGVLPKGDISRSLLSTGGSASSKFLSECLAWGLREQCLTYALLLFTLTPSSPCSFIQLTFIDTQYGRDGLPQWLRSKESTCNAGATGDAGWIPGLGRSSGEGHGNPLQYSSLENPMVKGAWWATVHSPWYEVSLLWSYLLIKRWQYFWLVAGCVQRWVTVRSAPGPRLCRLDPVFGSQKVCPRASGSLCMKQRSFACPTVPGTPPELLLQRHFIQDQDWDWIREVIPSFFPPLAFSPLCLSPLSPTEKESRNPTSRLLLKVVRPLQWTI